MKTRTFAAELRKTLEICGVENSAFEARTLLEAALGKDAANRMYLCDEP